MTLTENKPQLQPDFETTLEESRPKLGFHPAEFEQKTQRVAQMTIARRLRCS